MEKKNVVVFGDEPRVSSRVLSVGFDFEHKYIYELIQIHINILEEFGEVVLKTRIGSSEEIVQKANKKARIGEKKEYWLNEAQTTFLVTTFKNTEKVIQFKKKLVKEFFSARKILFSIQKTKSTEEWVKSRDLGKDSRKEETKVIYDFIEYAKNQGSKSADKYYLALTKMENTELFIYADKFKNLREVMTSKQLINIATADQVVQRALTQGMAKNLPYKDIFVLAKSAVITFASLVGRSEIATHLISEAEKGLLE